MVSVARWGVVGVLGALLSACSSIAAADARAAQDTLIGRVETARYTFVAADGLLHVRAFSDDEVNARASAAEFSFSLTRRDPSVDRVRVLLWNLPAGFTLTAAPGVLTAEGAPSAGEPQPDLMLGRAWTVTFPDGVETVEVQSTPPGTQPFTFLAFGDIQNGIDRFHEVVDRVNAETDADFVLMLGDLTSSSRDDQFDRVEAEYARLRIPIYATPGNHDVNVMGNYQERFGRANYSFTHKGARFTSIDSGSAAVGEEMFEWYTAWTEAGRDALHVTFSHIPALEVLGLRSGQWNSRRQAHHFIARSVETDVDLLLFGHLHSFDRYVLGGIPTFISGGCGAFEEKLDGISRHFLRVRADPSSQSLDVQVVRVDP